MLFCINVFCVDFFSSPLPIVNKEIHVLSVQNSHNGSGISVQRTQRTHFPQALQGRAEIFSVRSRQIFLELGGWLAEDFPTRNSLLGKEAGVSPCLLKAAVTQ